MFSSLTSIFVSCIFLSKSLWKQVLFVIKPLFFTLLHCSRGRRGAETYKGQMRFRQGKMFQLPWPLAQMGAALASLGPALADGRRRLRSTTLLLVSLSFGEDSMPGLHSPSSCPSWMEGSAVVLNGG